jgi:hypothetical protein
MYLSYFHLLTRIFFRRLLGHFFQKFICRLQVIESIPVLQDLVEDYAAFLAVHSNGLVAVGSRFGRIGLLQNGDTSFSLLHSAPTCIDLLQEKDSRGITIMPQGIERLASLHLADMPSGWPVPDEDKSKSRQRENFKFTLWVGVESVALTTADSRRGCTRVGPVSISESTDPYIQIHWYQGKLPNRSSPAPSPSPLSEAADGPPFFSFVDAQATLADEPDKIFYEYIDRKYYECSTAAKCAQTNLSTLSVYFENLRRLSFKNVTCWHWEVDAESENEENNGYVVVLATSAGNIHRLSMSSLVKINDDERVKEPSLDSREFSFAENPKDSTALFGWNAVDTPRLAFGSWSHVEEGIIAMAPVPGHRLVCVTDKHALVLLRLNETTLVLKTISPVKSMRYSFVHCYQGSGSLTSCAKYHKGGVVTAVRGGSFGALRAKSELYQPPVGTKKTDNATVGMDIDENLEEKGLSAEEAVAAAAGEGGELNSGDDVNEEAGEDTSVGGAAAYGAPGALITMYPDTVLEKMFEGAAGDVSGVTGLWPLKKIKTDTHHAAVLLASTANARVLAVDGTFRNLD